MIGASLLFHSYISTLELQVGLWLSFCLLGWGTFSGSASFYVDILWWLFCAFVCDIFGGPLILQGICMMVRFLTAVLLFHGQNLCCLFLLVYLVQMGTSYIYLVQIPFECPQRTVLLVLAVLSMFHHSVWWGWNHSWIVGVSPFLFLWMFLDWMSGCIRVLACWWGYWARSRARQNRRGESISPWKISHRIFTMVFLSFLSKSHLSLWKHRQTNPPVYCHDQLLEEVQAIKLWGLTISHELSWTDYRAKLAYEASHRLCWSKSFLGKIRATHSIHAFA